MSLLRAFVWLHWRQQLNALRAGRRSTFSRASAWLQILVQAILGVLFAGAAAALAILGFFAGQALVSGGEGRGTSLAMIRVVLGFFMFLALILPLIRASFGSLPGTERLLLLPIARRRLHLLESVTYLTDPWLLMTIPGFVALSIPILGSSPVGGLTVALAGGAFLVLLGLLAAALTYGIRIVLRDRRRAEAAALVFFLLIMALSFLPVLLDGGTDTGRADSGTGRRVEAGPPGQAPGSPREGTERVGDFAGADVFPWPLQILPSEAFSRIAERASAGAPASALISFLPMGAAGLAAWLVSWGFWRRLVASPETASKRREARELPRLRDVPIVHPPTAAVALAFLRTVMRTVQGKLILVMPTVVVVVFSVLEEAESGPWARLFGGPSLVLVAAFFAVSGMQNILLNLFGMDGAGSSLLLLQPISSRELIRGKAAGGAMVLGIVLAPAIAAAWFLGAEISFAAALAGILAGAALYLLFFPVAAWLSILFPKASDLSKMGSEGKPHGAAMAVGFLTLLFLAALPAAAGFAGLVLAGPAGALAAELVLCFVSALLFVVFSNSAAAVFELRREGVHLAIREG